MPALFYFSPHRCTYSKGGERNGMMRGLSQYNLPLFFLTLDHWWWLRTRWNLEEGTDRIEHHGIGKGRWSLIKKIINTLNLQSFGEFECHSTVFHAAALASGLQHSYFIFAKSEKSN
ncbi:hypothetical protein Peur_047437 [Populus x canadensis]